MHSARNVRNKVLLFVWKERNKETNKRVRNLSLSQKWGWRLKLMTKKMLPSKVFPEMCGRSGSTDTCIINLVVCGEWPASRPGKEPKVSTEQGTYLNIMSLVSLCVQFCSTQILLNKDLT
jgi:hypothetical protein